MLVRMPWLLAMVIRSPGTSWLATSWLKLLAKRFLTVRFLEVAEVVGVVAAVDVAGGKELSLVGTRRESVGVGALGPGLVNEATMMASRPPPL